MKNLLLFIAVTFVIGIYSLNAQIIGWDPIIPDFQVNDNKGVVRPWQGFPAIASNNSGRTILVWVDWRNGTSAIYAQLFSDSGVVIDSNFKLVNDSLFTLITSPSVAMDSIGNFIVTWKGKSSIIPSGIYARRFAFNGMPLSSEFKVNDGLQDCYFPDIASDETGNFVITWEDYRNGHADIYAQRFSANGIIVDANFKVNDDSQNIIHWTPSISSDDYGNFVITWFDTRNHVNEIYAQRFSNEGTPLDTNFRIATSTSVKPQIFPDVSHDAQGNFVIIWYTGDNFIFDLYAQLFNPNGIRIGDTIKVNENGFGPMLDSKIAVSMSHSGNFTVSWVTFPPGINDVRVYGQRVSFNGTLLGNNFTVNDDSVYTIDIHPAMTTYVNGNFTIAWEDNRKGWDHNVFIQRYSDSGLPLDSNYLVNDDTLSNADQNYPSVDVGHDGSFVVCWEDHRNARYSPDIYTQRYTDTGEPINANFKVNDDTVISEQNYPDMDMDGNDNYVIVWSDYRNWNRNIYGQYFLNDGSPLGHNFKVNDVSENFYSYATISMDSSGNFVVTWIQRRSQTGVQVFAQRFTFGGIPVGNNFIVSDDTIFTIKYFPDVALDQSGNFVITWTDSRNGFLEIYAQRFSSDGSKLGGNFKINEDSAGVHHFIPNVEMTLDGDFIISWYLSEIGIQSAKVYARKFSANGIALSNSIRVSEDGFLYDAENRKPGISVASNGDFVITWEKRLIDSNCIYAQRFSSDGTPIGHNFLLTSNLSGVQHSPDVKLWNNRIYSTWEDNRAGNTGFDIWANVLDFSNPVAVDERTTSKIPPSFRLEANFPNPFNPSTTISYRIPGKSIVDITIFNVLGQKVKSLVHRRQLPGYYRVKWDGTDDSGKPVASGIYLYQLKTKTFVKTRKMILLR